MIENRHLTPQEIKDYDYIIVAFSGGKDSTACVLRLLDQGIDKNKIELWHHEIDGREGNALMDWPCTANYCRAFAESLGLRLYFSWKQGGFSREMLRDNQLTAPTLFENENYEIMQTGGERGKKNTRRKFPQVAADLKVRWCSAYLKIDVCSTAIRNQERFNGKRTLLVSGERAEESPGRAKYKIFEADRSDNREGRTGRHVDRYRSIHEWKEEKVWQIIEKHKIKVHPAYYIGWGRVSCASCIFGSKDQWASLNKINPDHVKNIIKLEKEFGFTINRNKSVIDLITEGCPYDEMDEKSVNDSLNFNYNQNIILDSWKLPSGAFGESCGPV